MALKIKYLDEKKGSSKNKAIILAKESKISDFKGIFDDNTNQKIINFLKNNKKNKDNKIFSLNKSCLSQLPSIAPLLLV